MRQACGTKHQRRCDAKDINLGFGGRGIFGEAKIGYDLIQLGQHGYIRARRVTDKSELRDRIARDGQTDENRGNSIGKDQHNILRNLRIGDALHPAQHGIDKDYAHPDQNTKLKRNAEKARKGHADAFHLPGNIGETDHQRADHSNDPRGFGVITIANKIGHGKFPKLPQIGRKQKGQQHITACPAHQINTAAISQKGDQSRHGEKARRAHPVGGCRHAIYGGVDVVARNVKLICAARPRPDCNADIDSKGGDDPEDRPRVNDRAAHDLIPNLRSSCVMRMQ